MQKEKPLLSEWGQSTDQGKKNEGLLTELTAA